MSDPSTAPARRQRTSEDPWVLACRVVHDLRRDGIAVHSPDAVMGTLAALAAAMLETAPGRDPAGARRRRHRGPGRPGAAWRRVDSGPSSPPA